MWWKMLSPLCMSNWAQCHVDGMDSVRQELEELKAESISIQERKSALEVHLATITRRQRHLEKTMKDFGKHKTSLPHDNEVTL